ncbi:uncharacterized protein LOC122676690 isoform X2 [Cervus elaphus]|uniref:uncharacterized protein LOC122676690 isoform X2 n=1 Tax=Cervus elaphus TaxID=9860 RepID=UPI001CC278E2|nr:uncharacterized protein LOC122676690 isoform X2 [Cervus elaphus]
MEAGRLAHAIRLLLEYTDSNYEEKKYTMGDTPDYNKSQWLNEKSKLGLDFPNDGDAGGPSDQALLFFQLPYLIDGTHKLTQSNAILRHIARKHNMWPEEDLCLHAVQPLPPRPSLPEACRVGQQVVRATRRRARGARAPETRRTFLHTEPLVFFFLFLFTLEGCLAPLSPSHTPFHPYFKDCFPLFLSKVPPPPHIIPAALKPPRLFFPSMITSAVSSPARLLALELCSELPALP